MIGTGLKKLAAPKGMKVAHGVAYGVLEGYAATLSEGAGYKKIVLTTMFADAEKSHELRSRMVQRNAYKEFRVEQLEVLEKRIDIVFHDDPGTMKKILAFAEWFFPVLNSLGATKADICVECGGTICGGSWKLIDGIAYHMHESCAQKILRGVQEQEETQKNHRQESYLLGAAGALLGAALGGILWAVVLYFGYVAALVGLLIGVCAEKGYDLLHGKQGKGKILILLLAIVAGVLLGTLGASVYELVRLIATNELYGYTYGDIPMLLGMLMEDPEFVSSAGREVLVGLIYAGLGTIGVLIQAGKKVSSFKMVDLE